MSVSLDSSSRLIDGRIFAICLAFLCAGLIATGALIEQQPFVAAAAILTIPATIFVCARPESAVPLALFVIYSNAAVVAVRFHGVPAIAAALAPAPLAIPLFYNIVLRRRPIVVTPVLPWIVAYIGWQLICALFSRDPDTSLDGVKGNVLEGLLMYVLVTNVVRTPQVLRMAVWALVAAGAFMGSVSVYQQATRSFDSDFGGFGQVSGGRGFKVAHGHGVVQQRRLSGPIGEKNRYAQVMLMLIPLALSRFWTERTRPLRLLALGAAVFCGMGCALTFSRSGALAFVLMLVVGLGLRFISRRQIVTLAAGGLLLLLAVPQYRTRLATIPTAMGIFGSSSAGQEEPDGAIRGRATEMLAAGRIAVHHPIFGVGPDLSGTYTREFGRVGGLRALEGDRESHCMYLEIPAETGFPGLLLFSGMLTTSIYTLLRARQLTIGSNRELEQTVSGFLLALTGYLVMGVFLHMSYIRYFWLMLAMADACNYVAQTSTTAGPEAASMEAIV
jgi:putative inorganic carbon (hco3(-)) transporter